MKLWVILIVLYGILKGLREPIKKKALQRDHLMGVLFLYTFLGFLMVAPTTAEPFAVPIEVFGLIIVKSAAVFAGWMFAFMSVKKMPISLYSVIDMSRMLFSTFLGVIFLGEELTVKGTVSLIVILLGLYLVNRKKSVQKEEFDRRFIWVTIASCALNAVSGTLDKYIMSTGKVTSGQLQFWFMLLLSVFYLLYILLRREQVRITSCLRNPYIYLLSILLIIGDRMLFIANADPDSRVTIMTLLKQSAVLVAIAAGRVIYKEKNIMYKLMCAGIISVGIVLAII